MQQLLALLLVVALPQHGNGASYVGFWGADVSETSSFTNLQFGPNASELVAGAKLGVQGMYPMHDVVFGGGKLRRDYRTSLAAAVPEVNALLDNKTIIGIFMGDELIWNCMTYEDLNTGIDAVRSAFPRGRAIIWQNEAAIHPPSYTDSCKKDHLDYRIPQGLDWYSVDIYHMDGPTGNNWVHNSVQTYYEELIFPNLTAGQSVAVVPGFFGSDVNRYPNGTYVCNSTCYDDMCAIDANDFFSWMAEEQRIAAVLPWNWNGCPACNGSRWTPPHTCCMDEIGGRDMPQARAAWTRLGKLITGK